MAMSLISEAKSVIDLLAQGWTWRRNRRDPVRAQAQRVIQAFEAHGIRRQQIAGVLTPELAMPSTFLSTADNLKDRITPALLDWAAAFLGLRRGWFDGVEPQPHRRVDGYKDPQTFLAWLTERAAPSNGTFRALHVLVGVRGSVGPSGSGPIVVIYEEQFAQLDEQELSRYWLLSDGWTIEHPPCVSNLMALCVIAQHLRVLIIGRVADTKRLIALEEDKTFAPMVLKTAGQRWYPEDLLDSPSGDIAEWQHLQQRDLVDLISSSGLSHLLAAPNRLGKGSSPL